MEFSPTDPRISLKLLKERAQVITNKLTYVRPMTDWDRDFLLAELQQIEHQIETF